MTPKSILYSLFSILFILTLCSCSAADLPGVVTITAPLPSPGAATATPFAISGALPSPTLGFTATPLIATVTAPVMDATTTPTAAPAAATNGTRPLYMLDATMNYEAKSIDITQEITYPNQTGASLSQIVLSVQPNLLENVFNLASLTIDGQKLESFTLDGQRLEVPLATPLAAGASVKMGLAYTLTLPIIEQGDPNVVRPRIFGVADRQVNLVDWYPFVVPYINGAWVLQKPWFYGEHLVYEKADFDVSLQFTDAENLPVIAASAPAEPVSNGRHYRFDNARDFSFSMGRQFEVISQQTEGGVTVSSYYLGAEKKAAAQAALDASVKAIGVYGERFGAYPHKMLAIVQGDFNDGMEFDGFYFLPDAFYNLYDGTEKNYLVLIAAHETAHQWWFGRVANDQAQEPWLDESLATYSERIFLEKYYPDDLKWWWDLWNYRPDQCAPAGLTDTLLYNGSGFCPYTKAVYLTGAQFLEDLRQQIGDESFFAFLKDYSTQMDGKIATSVDFFHVLRAHTSEDFSPLLTKYFQDAH